MTAILNHVLLVAYSGLVIMEDVWPTTVPRKTQVHAEIVENSEGLVYIWWIHATNGYGGTGRVLTKVPALQVRLKTEDHVEMGAIMKSHVISVMVVANGTHNDLIGTVWGKAANLVQQNALGIHSKHAVQITSIMTRRAVTFTTGGNALMEIGYNILTIPAILTYSAVMETPPISLQTCA